MFLVDFLCSIHVLNNFYQYYCGCEVVIENVIENEFVTQSTKCYVRK